MVEHIARLGLGRSFNGQGKNDECFTPPEIFETLGIEFDLDVASPIGGVSWIPCKKYLTIEDDGLTAEWNGRVWMNPPFSKLSKWAPRFQKHANGIALVPTSNGKWMRQLFEDQSARWLMLDRPRFIKSDGSRYERYLPTRTYLVAYGEECHQALNRLGNAR